MGCNPVSVSGATGRLSSPEIGREYGEDLSPNGLYHQNSWTGARPPRVKQIFTLRYNEDRKMWQLDSHTPGQPDLVSTDYRSATTGAICPEDEPVLSTSPDRSGHFRSVTVSCPGLGTAAIVL